MYVIIFERSNVCIDFSLLFYTKKRFIYCFLPSIFTCVRWGRNRGLNHYLVSSCDEAIFNNCAKLCIHHAL